LPKHPVTRPKAENIEKSEEALDVDKLITDAIKDMKIYTIE
jgi:thiamine biosynthesis protein ThiI